MSKFRVSTREIGAVSIFDLEGSPEHASVPEVADKIQKSIRRFRKQRVILNFSHVDEVDAIGMRRILASCIRPKQSAIYGANSEVIKTLQENHLPKNIGICEDEKEVAEQFGPFLFDKDEDRNQPYVNVQSGQDGLNKGEMLERRRSVRMHVALPLELKIYQKGGDLIESIAIATNISAGGLFAEYLDLDVADKVDRLENLAGSKAEIHIFPCANFPEHYTLMGIILRKECRKKQLGVAVRFID